MRSFPLADILNVCAVESKETPRYETEASKLPRASILSTKEI